MLRRGLLLVVCCVVFSIGPAAASSETEGLRPVRYTLRFDARRTHYVEVEAVVPAEGRDPLEVFMPVWTPGSYMVREYAGQLEGMRAFAGDRELSVVKSRKNRWRIAARGAGDVTLRYRLYAFTPAVRYNWVESDFAMLNGAATFVSPVESGRHRPHEVTLVLPSGWAGAWTPMPPVEGRAWTFRAADFDALVDSPIVAGSPATHGFVVDGKRHTLVLAGDTRFFDRTRAAKDVERIVESTRGLMGSLPYPSYHFLTMLTGGSDGLEHADGFLIMSDRFTTRTRRAYLNWLSLVAHEYFHAWNVKRMRPVELGPFDYESENYVSTLWMAEGFTDYYADLIVRRSDLCTPQEYLASLSDAIESVQRTPGRRVTTVSDASMDAWIKQYRPNENTPNSTIDYYSKGAVVAFLLDARIRRATGGLRSLDDVMRLGLQRYSGARGFSADDFFRLASEVAGTDLRPWFSEAVGSTRELDFHEALEYYGLRFGGANALPPDGARAAALGLTTRRDDGRIVVAALPADSPSFDSGLDVHDEILALDDVRVMADELPERLAQYRPGDVVEVLFARRGRVGRAALTLVPEEPRAWRLEAVPEATGEQRQHLAAWIGR
jgi:predicted metalloprotease with PDZ domain